MWDVLAASSETAVQAGATVSNGFWPSLFKFLAEVFTNPVTGAGTVSILLIVSGLNLIRHIHRDSPFAPVVLPVLGLAFILPCVIMSGLILSPPPTGDAILGIIGTIAGYAFGSVRSARASETGQSEQDKNKDAEQDKNKDAAALNN